MDSAAAAPPPVAHEVIVISDDEDDTMEETSSSSSSAGSFSWSAVADQLLVLAKHSEVRADPHVLETLLQDIGAPASLDLRRRLQFACEQLGQLLLLSRGHARRVRSCEELVLVVCEVLSLAQTAPAQEPQATPVKKETTQGFNVDDMLQLMDKWSGMLMECSRTSLGRERAFNSTITRLEKLTESCIDEKEQLVSSAAKHAAEREKAAEQWKNVLDKCITMMDHQPEPSNCLLIAFESALDMAQGETAAFHDHDQARIALLQKAKEMEMRREFFAACLQLTFTIAGLPGCRAEEDECGASLCLLENEILAAMENFCGGLRNAMELTEALSFSKQFKLFWLIRRDWFPAVVLDVVFSKLDGLLRSTKQCESPVRTAISRICTGLRAG